MRAPFVLVSLLLINGVASAQDATSSPDRSTSIAVVTGGTSEGGLSLRLVRGGGREIGSVLTLGIVNRSVAAYSSNSETSDTPFPKVPSIYLESGASLRAGVPLGPGEVALSAGVAIASRTIGWAPFDAGFTAPVEVEASARVWRNVGLAASASASLPIVSVWSSYENADPDYSLSHRAVTVGLRFGM